MSMLGTIKQSETAAGEEDVLGGGGRKVWESDIYKCTVTMAYVLKSAGGAMGVALELKNEAGDLHRETVYITNKSGQNFYVKDGQENQLPGWQLVDSLALLTCNKSITELEEENMVIKLYNFDQKKELPTTVPMLKDLLGKEVYAAIQHTKSNKTQRNDATGTYDPINEAVERNELSKFFYSEDRRTVPEIKAQAEEATFYANWKERFAGKVRDTFKEVANTGKPAGRTQSGGLMGANTAAQNQTQQKPAGSLFG